MFTYTVISTVFAHVGLLKAVISGDCAILPSFAGSAGNKCMTLTPKMRVELCGLVIIMWSHY